jgi:lipooligosaccharide transport system permease protein
MPLYHAVAMLRQLTTGNISPSIAGHLAYLTTLGIIAFSVAMYRLERVLIK